MKITALVPDYLIKQVKKKAKGANLTESLITALKEWVASKELAKIAADVRKTPLRFASEDIGARVRTLNRRTT